MRSGRRSRRCPRRHRPASRLHHMYIHQCVHNYIHKFKPQYLHTYITNHMHKHIHQYIHAHIHMVHVTRVVLRVRTNMPYDCFRLQVTIGPPSPRGCSEKGNPIMRPLRGHSNATWRSLKNHCWRKPPFGIPPYLGGVCAETRRAVAHAKHTEHIPSMWYVFYPYNNYSLQSICKLRIRKLRTSESRFIGNSRWT